MQGLSRSAFVHKPTNTLLVTDAVICVPSVSSSSNAKTDNLPIVFPLQPIFQIYFDEATITESTFWARRVLQAVFLPLRAEVTDEEMVYPGYESLPNRVVRALILRAFVDARAPDAVKVWAERLERREFDRIVTAHFASPINAGPFKAFSHLSSLDEEQAKNELLSTEISSSLHITCQDWIC
jgi:hypothetical protein